MKKLIVLALLCAPSAWSQPLSVVEFFTSHNCPACPPADTYFANTVVPNENLLALAYHVDYWDKGDRIDPFSHADFTQRQYDYSNTLSSRPGRVYTPQFVVNGHMVGRKPFPWFMPTLYKKAAQEPLFTVNMTRDTSGTLSLHLPQKTLENQHDVWLVGYDKTPEKDKTLRRTPSVNVVKSFQHGFIWFGDEKTHTIPADLLPKADIFAVLVQENTPGKIIGTGNFDLSQPFVTLDISKTEQIQIKTIDTISHSATLPTE